MFDVRMLFICLYPMAIRNQFWIFNALVSINVWQSVDFPNINKIDKHSKGYMAGNG